MRDFSHEFGERLRVLEVDLGFSTGRHAPKALESAADHATPRAAQRPQPRRRRAYLGGVLALGGIAASTALVTGTSAAGLPFLSTPASAAPRLARDPTLAAARVDFEHVHTARASGGVAAVLTTKDGRRICLALADPASPSTGDAGSSCSPAARVEQAGLLGVLVGVRDAADPKRRINHAGFILPVKAVNPRIDIGAGNTPASVDAGVVLATFDRGGTLRYDIGHRTVTITLPAPFATESIAQCKDHTATVVERPGATADAPGTVDFPRTCGKRSTAP